MKTTKATALTPRQSKYLHSYHDPSSPTFGNSYQSALSAGYSDQTARNFNHLQPEWLSENIGQMAITAISPEQIMATLTAIINDGSEPTIIKLKAMEMTMKAYNMLAQRHDTKPTTVTLNVDLTNSG